MLEKEGFERGLPVQVKILICSEILRLLLNKIFEKAPTELIAPKRVVVFLLPYTGLHSIQIRKKNQ